MTMIDEILNEYLDAKKVISITLSKQRKKSQEVKKITLRPIAIDNKLLFQWEEFRGNQVFHRNLLGEEAYVEVKRSLEELFKEAYIFTREEDIHILCSKPDNPKIKKSSPSKAMPSLSLDHNKKKNYIIEENVPCDFLIYLGVMTKEGKVVKKHYNKFRQINRYLEIVSDSLSSLPNDEITIIDFGCGKAYLTFALYYYLVKVLKKSVSIIGLDLKKDVINFCNKVAEDLDYKGLTFEVGDISQFKASRVDMVVTLHACDTATDYALINAVNWGAKVILSVPCCQHQLFKQINNEIHQPMLKHGILKDRLTEYLTDGLRGLKLEEAGYKVSMIEFTPLEHTAKNIMIKAIKTKATLSKQKKAREEYMQLCNFYKVAPAIDNLKTDLD